MEQGELVVVEMEMANAEDQLLGCDYDVAPGWSLFTMRGIHISALGLGY